jgi:hypothetical protein
VAKYKYWTGIRHDNSERPPPIGVPETFYAQALRQFDDTHARSIWCPHMRVKVGGSNPPPEGWWFSASVRLAVQFADYGFPPASSDVTDNDPSMLGFIDLKPTFVNEDTLGGYVISWDGPAEGLDLHGPRKGTQAANLPYVFGSMWLFDHHGVWANAGAWDIKYSITCAARVLWESSLPTPP